MMTNRPQVRREGAVAVFLCILLAPLLALFAFSVDYGFLLFVRTDLQRSADQAALAAVRDLLPDKDGSQDLEKVHQTIRDYAEMNLADGFSVQDADIQTGRFNRNTVYNSVQLLDKGTPDTVRITVRRDDSANSSVALYFARLFDRDHADVTASSTAVLQPGRYVGPGAAVLPITMTENSWNTLYFGESVSVYGDGRIEDGFGTAIPGNWGTVDIGATSNSTSDLWDQINHGLRQSDLDSLHQQGVIPDSSHIDSQMSISLNGDTGFSSGMKHAISENHGTIKLMPIYRNKTGKGGNLRFNVVGWGAVEIVDSNFSGSQNSYVQVRRTYMYDGNLEPVNDLSDESQAMEGVYTSPALAE
jgi:Flp pilus assembly protein TadG